MRWNVPDWFKSAGLDILFGLGLVAYESHARKKGEEEVAERVAERIKTPGHAIGHFLGKKMVKEAVNRPEFYEELEVINADPPGSIKAIVDLFHGIQNRRREVTVGAQRLPSRKGLVQIEGSWYRETWIIAKLQMIPVKYRIVSYQRLNRLLEKDAAAFVEDLSILNEDNWRQVLKQLEVVVSESRPAQVVRQVAATIDTVATDTAPAVNQVNADLIALRDRVRGWAQGR